MYSGNPLELLKNASDVYNAGRAAYDLYQGWAQEQTDRECQQLWQSVATLLNKGDYEKALPLLQQLTQKAPYDKARSLYLSAYCYLELRRRGEALQACEAAIQASPSEELLQNIYVLKRKIQFGFGFWIQWLLATVVIGAISLFGSMAFFTSEFNNSTSGLLAGLSMGISIGFVQWLLVRVLVAASIWSLITNVALAVVSIAISAMMLSVNVWLGLLAFLGCTILFTRLSISRLAKQLEATT